jgi:hypothetical protein
MPERVGVSRRTCLSAGAQNLAWSAARTHRAEVPASHGLASPVNSERSWYAINEPRNPRRTR